MTETWLPYPGSPFEVSDLGNVRSRAWNKLRPIRPYLLSTGYLAVNWRTRDAAGRIVRQSRLLHRMVLELFTGPCPEGMEACHWNGEKTDCRHENLRWDTPSANKLDKARHGRGGLTLHQVMRAKWLLKMEGKTQREVARIMGVTQPAISHIASGKVHKGVPWPLRKGEEPPASSLERAHPSTREIGHA